MSAKLPTPTGVKCTIVPEMQNGCHSTIFSLMFPRIQSILPVAVIYNYPSPSLDNVRVMVIVWRLRGNIIRTDLCWIVSHNVHSLQHTFMSSSYRSNILGLSHWDGYAVHRGGCLELYYCNMVEWFLVGFKPDLDDQLVSCLDTVGLVIWPVKIVSEMTYNVLSGTLSLYITTTTP